MGKIQLLEFVLTQQDVRTSVECTSNEHKHRVDNHTPGAGEDKQDQGQGRDQHKQANPMQCPPRVEPVFLKKKLLMLSSCQEPCLYAEGLKFA